MMHGLGRRSIWMEGRNGFRDPDGYDTKEMIRGQNMRKLLC
jgi:hypothetical protein